MSYDCRDIGGFLEVTLVWIHSIHKNLCRTQWSPVGNNIDFRDNRFVYGYAFNLWLLYQWYCFSGAHVEGPFINKEKKGAHNPTFITTPLQNGSKCVTEMYGSLDNVAMVTIAPELDGSLDTITEFLNKEVVVSIGKIV